MDRGSKKTLASCLSQVRIARLTKCTNVIIKL
nr:MAG TPA: hypothetical protein [Bacteriophage sp.]DAY83813.1 MAG TPA: hypothetical protein [Caudoviricetes sp.]DAZ22033.1 MAG TPA: hypothetical protein [Caudoviricetes sp.]